MTITVKIIRGDDALKYTRDEAFLTQWKTLADNTAHKTVFQESEFVSLWFHHYQQLFEPILVTAWNESEVLTGLMPLALDKSDNVLTQAGAQLAEYSGWLCSPSDSNSFLDAAFKSIAAGLNFSQWKWTYIAPGTDIRWLTSKYLKKIGIFIQLESMDSPLLDLHDEEKLKKVLKNKSVKSKINRLKRKGELKIERISDNHRALELMDQITNLVNFRHESAHHDAAFEDDILQRSFYEARSINLKDNHFSVLWVGEKLLAFHYGYIDEDSIYIGLSAFDPTESKHSPGVIFLIYLANLLIEEGIRYIDLTPGGDEYKERFSNAHNVIYLPNIYTSQFEYKKQALKNNVKSIALDIINNKKIKNLNIKKIFNKDSKHTPYTKNDFNLYSVKTDNYSPQSSKHDNEINIQYYSDLLNYQQKDKDISRQKILSDATFRFSREDTLFTIHKESQLHALSWLSKVGAKYTRLGFEFCNHKNSVVIDCMDLKMDLLESRYLQRLVSTMLDHTFSENTKEAFIFIPKSENTKTSVEILNKIGFELVDY